MQMHDDCLIMHLDAIGVQRGREAKKRRKIDGNASRRLTGISLRAFYHKSTSSTEQAGTLKVSNNPQNFSRCFSQTTSRATSLKKVAASFSRITFPDHVCRFVFWQTISSDHGFSHNFPFDCTGPTNLETFLASRFKMFSLPLSFKLSRRQVIQSGMDPLGHVDLIEKVSNMRPRIVDILILVRALPPLP